jgi:hypothetical protein
VNVLAKNRLTVVTVEGDGTARMFGRLFGLTMENSTGQSGTALADRNGYNLVLSSQEREDFLVVPANIVSALETPGT